MLQNLIAPILRVLFHLSCKVREVTRRKTAYDQYEASPREGPRHSTSLLGMGVDIGQLHFTGKEVQGYCKLGPNLKNHTSLKIPSPTCARRTRLDTLLSHQVSLAFC